MGRVPDTSGSCLPLGPGSESITPGSCEPLSLVVEARHYPSLSQIGTEALGQELLEVTQPVNARVSRAPPDPPGHGVQVHSRRGWPGTGEGVTWVWGCCRCPCRSPSCCCC